VGDEFGQGEGTLEDQCRKVGLGEGDVDGEDGLYAEGREGDGGAGEVGAE
jgi:hypothetical protein